MTKHLNEDDLAGGEPGHPVITGWWQIWRVSSLHNMTGGARVLGGGGGEEGVRLEM